MASPVRKKPLPVRAPLSPINVDFKEKGKGKEKERRSAFETLPREIIQQILYAADPNAFDSLTLVNSAWHQASRTPLLYAHQLRKSGAIDVPDELSEDLLPNLIQRFTAKARRELFETILHPQVTEIQLICEASSSAAAFPGGEPFRFEFSPRGKHLLALSSSRIFVLDLSKPEVEVKRELKISKRPVSAAIVDDGSAIAVLSSNSHVTLYDLTQDKARILKVIPLENEPRTIALSPGAEVLGAAYNGGIEVYSLLPDAVASDRRAVNCDTVDSLAFSSDGTILLGTTLNSRSPTTVIVSAQHFSTDMPVEGLAQLWTTQVLFPRSSRDSSHASLLQENHAEDENTWTFTYDRVYETFRAVRVDDLRNGHTYFTGPSSESLGIVAPTTLPAPTRDGRMVAAGFGGKVWVYGIPGKLDLPPEGSEGGSVNSASTTPERSNSTAGNGGSGSGVGGSTWERGQLGTINVPQWQVLCDKMRNVFIRGRGISEVNSLAGLKFVQCVNGTERLVAVAGGGVDSLLGEEGEEEFLAIGGGRVMLYDFGRRPGVGEKAVITMEIGDGIQGPVEILEEQQNDIEVEVDLVRRRTVAQKRNNDRRQSTLRYARDDTNSISPPLPPISRQPPPSPPRPSTASTISRLSFQENEPEYEGMDAVPYYHGDPRSRGTLQRAATAARNVPQTATSARYLRVVGPDGRPVQNQTMPGFREDEDWVPPPPPYTAKNDSDRPLPQYLLETLQGPPRFNNYADAPEEPSRASSALNRTRSTFGTIMRRPSVFRISTNNQSNLTVQPTHSYTDISQSRSAPVSPAVGNPGAAYMGVLARTEESAYVATQRQHSQYSRRGSAGDILTSPSPAGPIPSMYRESSAPLPQPNYTDFAGHYAPQPPQPPPPPQPYYGSSLLPDQFPLSPSPSSSRNSVQYRPMPTRRPSPGRSPSRGRRGNLQESYAPNSSLLVFGESGHRRNPSSRGGSVRSSGGGGGAGTGSIRVGRGVRGSVRRNPSRPERSAAANVRERKKRRGEGMAAEGRGGGEVGCVIM
ncbi:hypothetical protein L873DRAFT_1742145 [Choiromyces venosus 120613-1]|uniref:DUF7165 domain-containing protein n=1 Tax=Choiromyces venosus 120613-1 TaxID=1336337 RepID=A0A3N4JGZ7_9PEZI|nr:hypothetical protein L873DRAFT_1742145 [Choiromyces venosus 120613-1]